MINAFVIVPYQNIDGDGKNGLIGPVVRDQGREADGEREWVLRRRRKKIHTQRKQPRLLLLCMRFQSFAGSVVWRYVGCR